MDCVLQDAGKTRMLDMAASISRHMVATIMPFLPTGWTVVKLSQFTKFL